MAQETRPRDEARRIAAGGQDAVDAADKAGKAYEQLLRLANDQRKPEETISQAFARVSAMRENAQLLADSILLSRARATSQYPGQV